MPHLAWRSLKIIFRQKWFGLVGEFEFLKETENGEVLIVTAENKTELSIII